MSSVSGNSQWANWLALGQVLEQQCYINTTCTNERTQKGACNPIG